MRMVSTATGSEGNDSALKPRDQSEQPPWIMSRSWQRRGSMRARGSGRAAGVHLYPARLSLGSAS